MPKKTHILCLAAALLLAVCIGGVLADGSAKGLDSIVLTVTPGNTNTTMSATNATVRGYLESVSFAHPAATVTSTVNLVWQPGLSTLDSITVATTNDIAADVVIRPRWVSEDTGGSVLASVEGIRFPVCAGKLVFSVTGTSLSGSNTAHKVLIKYWKN